VTHPRAKLTVQGRQLLVERVLEGGWTVPMAAEAQGCSAATGYKWLRRFAAEGLDGLRDRSSRPHCSPARLSQAREHAILERRHATLEGPHRIAWALGEVPSTVHRVLRRWGAPRLRDLDRPTRTVVRYERDGPESSYTSTSKSRAGSRSAEAGVSTASTANEAVVPTRAPATTSSTPPSTTAPAWPTRRSFPMSARRPHRRS
jgi:transposase